MQTTSNYLDYAEVRQTKNKKGNNIQYTHEKYVYLKLIKVLKKHFTNTSLHYVQTTVHVKSPV